MQKRKKKEDSRHKEKKGSLEKYNGTLYRKRRIKYCQRYFFILFCSEKEKRRNFKITKSSWWLLSFPQDWRCFSKDKVENSPKYVQPRLKLFSFPFSYSLFCRQYWKFCSHVLIIHCNSNFEDEFFLWFHLQKSLSW